MPFHTICIQYGLIFFNLPNEKILFWGSLVSVIWLYPQLGFPGGSAGKESACNAGDLGWRPGFNPWVGKIPWRRERLPTPLFWLGEFHGLYSPWGRKELDRTERLSLSHVLVCSSCYNKTSWTRGIKEQTLVSQSCVGCTFKIEVPDDSLSDKSPRPGLQMVAFLPCPHVAERERERALWSLIF